MLVLLHEIIWVYPAGRKMAPVCAWSALGQSLRVSLGPLGVRRPFPKPFRSLL